jgi:hypothetical protein
MNNNMSPPGGGLGAAANFNGDRAAQMRAQVVDFFRARSRKIERRLCVWLVLILAAACKITSLFFAATETQTMIWMAVLLLVMIESTILMKLWYWIVSTRLGTQRELRLLRLDLALRNDTLDTTELASVESPTKPQGLSKWERAAWKVAILILGIGVGLGGFRFLNFFSKTPPVFQNVIRLDANGVGQDAVRWTRQNKTVGPMKEVPLYDGGAISGTEFIPASDSPYRDSQGRSLAIRREPAGQNHRNVIQLISPVPPADMADIFWTREVKAHREDDLWVLTLGPGNSYHTTLELPPGAELVSVEPRENSRKMEDGRLSLTFIASTPPDKLVSYTIKYRLPQATSAP